MHQYRLDITRALVHLSGDRASDGGMSAEDALCSIIKEKKIRGSGNSGYVKGSNTAACFTEMPLSSLTSFITNHGGGHKYSKYGIALSKSMAWSKGARPVIYLPDNEAIWIPEQEKWRQVKFELGSVDFTHEREWRCKGDLDLFGIGIYIIVPNKEAETKLRNSAPGYEPLGYLHLDTLSDLL